MKIAKLMFYYAIECENCGQEAQISYRDLRHIFVGDVPEEVVASVILNCNCQFSTNVEPVSLTSLYVH